jgi:hypothetical protein
VDRQKHIWRAAILFLQLLLRLFRRLFRLRLPLRLPLRLLSLLLLAIPVDASPLMSDVPADAPTLPLHDLSVAPLTLTPLTFAPV